MKKPTTILSRRPAAREYVAAWGTTGASIDLHSFTKGLVAGLIQRDVKAVYPHDKRDRRAFEKVVRLLDKEIERLRKAGTPASALLALARVANELRPSNTGTFEGFEAALRSLQLTFTSSPNPFYDDIAFPVSKTQALSFIDKMPPLQKHLALSAAKAFVAERRRQHAIGN